jgi:hypothetical protein
VIICQEPLAAGSYCGREMDGVTIAQGLHPALHAREVACNEYHAWDRQVLIDAGSIARRLLDHINDRCRVQVDADYISQLARSVWR